MPQTKTAAPVLQHRDGQTKNFITCILPHISPICKAFANFTLTACGLGALCAVVAALVAAGGHTVSVRNDSLPLPWGIVGDGQARVTVGLRDGQNVDFPVQRTE